MKKSIKRCELDNCAGKKSIKKDALEKTLSLIEEGKGKGELKKILKLSPSALSNRLKRLENLGCIELIGKYGINYISSSHKHPEVTRNQVHKKLNKRGHAFNFTILFPNEKDELRRKEKVIKELRQKRITELKNGCLRLEYKGYTIWINKQTLTIYSNNYYYSKDALYTKFRQIKELDNLVGYLKQRYGFTGIYGLEVFREHYGLIFNKFADWLLRQKRKLDIKDNGNKSIIWVDDSRKDDIGLKEFEGKNALEINKADKLFESHDRTGWEHTPEKVQDQIGETISLIKMNAKNAKELVEENKKTLGLVKQNAENAGYYGENMISHVAIMKRINKKLENMDQREERLIRAIERLASK